MAGAGQFKNDAELLTNMTNAIMLLPPDIQTLTRQQINQEASAVFPVYEKDDDLMMRFAVYFLRKGYGPRSPLDAMSFLWGYSPSDGSRNARAIDNYNGLDDDLRGPFPKVYHSLQEYEKANPPIPDIVTIVSRCAHMMHEAETQGAETPYELWRAVLSICKFSTGRTPAIIGELTGGHPDFDIGLAAQKMQDISAPFLCATFATYDNSLCKACKFNGVVKSPIALGYIREPSTKRRAAK
jgi:hypothetical protein